MIYIGIDTGVHTGIAIWDNRKRSLEMVNKCLFIGLWRLFSLMRICKDGCRR